MEIEQGGKKEGSFIFADKGGTEATKNWGNRESDLFRGMYKDWQ